MQCLLHVNFAEPDYEPGPYTGLWMVGLNLTVDESEVKERLEDLYGLVSVYDGKPVVRCVDVTYLQEEVVQ